MSHQGVLSTKQQEAAFSKILKKQCNLICADCSSKSPTWVSLDFGVFVCYNCSGQHRALGQNITRVRSTKLDCWTQENVDLMNALGNDQNEYWESRLQKNQKIQPSATPEEIKLFVQEKYVKKTWVKQGQADPKTRYTQCLMSGVPFRVAKTNTFFSENGTQGQQIKDEMKQFHSTQQQGIQRNNRQFSIDSKQTQKEANLISPDKSREFDWNSFNHFSTFSGVPQSHSYQTHQIDIVPKKQQQNEDQSPSFKPKNNNLNEFDLLTYSTQTENQQFMSYNPTNLSTTQQQNQQQFNTYNPQQNTANQQSWQQAQKQAQIQSQQQTNQLQQQNQIANMGNNSFGTNNQQQPWNTQQYYQTQQPQQQNSQSYNQANSKPPLPGKQNNVQNNYQNMNFIQQQQPQAQQSNQIPNYTQQPQAQQQPLNQQQYVKYQYSNQIQQNNSQNFGFENQINNSANSNQQIYQDFNNIKFPTDQGQQSNNNNNTFNFSNSNNNYNNNNQQSHQFNTTNQFLTQKYQNNPFVKDVQDIMNLYGTQQPGKYDQFRNNPFV